MRTMSRRVLKLAALPLAAVAIGSAAALGAGGGGGGASVYAHGTHNCVKYAHTVVPGSSWYAGPCTTVNGTMTAYSAYQTPSWAWREYNEISLNEDRYWEVGLFDTSGNWHRYNAGSGFWGWNSAVTAAQTRGQCTVSPTNAAGFCFVNSHL